MYDFYFGTKQEIEDNQEEFLIFVKRLLPRWINGIPDSECLAIYRVLKQIKSGKPVLVETGCGASTLAMFLYCALNNGKMFSWDTNGSKGFFLKSVISEAICRFLNVNIYDIWSFIGYDSTSKQVGIPVLNELGEKANFGFFDSWHTLDHLMNEIKCFEQVAINDFYIALDDAYYTKKSENYSYLNMIRKKLSLDPVQESPSNKCKPFYKEVEKYLIETYTNVEKIDDTYKIDYKSDIFFDYYESDRKSMGRVGMEEEGNLKHRFDIWSINKKR